MGSCYYLEFFGSFLEWMVCYEMGILIITHNLDYFLFVCPADYFICAFLLGAFCRLMDSIGQFVESKKVTLHQLCLTVSCFQMLLFMNLHPRAQEKGVSCPEFLWVLVERRY